MHTSTFLLKFGSLSPAVTLKIRSKSPKPNELFCISQCYIHANLVKIHPQVHEILCIQESVTFSVEDIIKDQITSLKEAYINLLLKDSWSEASSGSLYCLFDLGFMALHHLSGHFGRGQLT